MTELSPIMYSILDKIASGEAHSYGVVYGGHHFKSFTDHPGIEIPLGNGQFTTAAGRYQMTLPTWQEEKQRLGLKDFSPASQDAAAWDLADRTYRSATGRDLQTDYQNDSVDWSKLGSRWTSLKTASAAAAPSVTQVEPQLEQAPPQLTAQAAPPQHQLSLDSGLNNQPRNVVSAEPVNPFMGLIQLAAPHMNFHPVDYDPFAVQPKLVPIDYDPFQEELSHATAS